MYELILYSYFYFQILDNTSNLKQHTKDAFICDKSTFSTNITILIIYSAIIIHRYVYLHIILWYLDVFKSTISTIWHWLLRWFSDPTKHHQQHKQNTKRSETKTRGISPFPINSAWPQSRNLWSSFNENFFNGGFPDASFGDWKSKIEERSNKVLDRYDSSPSIPEEPFKGS